MSPSNSISFFRCDCGDASKDVFMEDASVRMVGNIPIAVAVKEFLMNFLRWLAIKKE
jgi:hypothetical protein